MVLLHRSDAASRCCSLTSSSGLESTDLQSGLTTLVPEHDSHERDMITHNATLCGKSQSTLYFDLQLCCGHFASQRGRYNRVRWTDLLLQRLYPSDNRSKEITSDTL